MVVGDDDQTIYEWRGARPQYLLKEFETTFTTKPHKIFKLDQTFRFGPLLAQYAQNSISLNKSRHVKSVFANNPRNPCDIELIFSSLSNVFEPNMVLANMVAKLVKEEKIAPFKIRVISRLYSQLTDIESWFIVKGIPYRIDGNMPFYKRREVLVLIDYLILFESLSEPFNQEIQASLFNILNTPNRRISKSRQEILLKKRKSMPLIDILEEHSNEDENIAGLISFLINGNVTLSEMQESDKYRSSQILEWTFANSKLEDHYNNYYGNGEKSSTKIQTIKGLIKFTEDLTLSPKQLKEFITGLDSTKGLKDDQLILMSTVHKTKGLEFDYVFIPDCLEGNMPYITSNNISIYDVRNPSLVGQLSESLESERRLFYVAITRAMKLVVIGASERENSIPSRFLEEISFSKTREVLYPIVHDNIEPKTWFNSLRHVLGRKSIIKNIRKYLHLLGKHEIREAVDKFDIETPEEEFAYEKAYPLNKIPKPVIEPPSLADPWKNVPTN